MSRVLPCRSSAHLYSRGFRTLRSVFSMRGSDGGLHAQTARILRRRGRGRQRHPGRRVGTSVTVGDVGSAGRSGKCAVGTTAGPPSRQGHQSDTGGPGAFDRKSAAAGLGGRPAGGGAGTGYLVERHTVDRLLPGGGALPAAGTAGRLRPEAPQALSPHRGGGSRR